MDKATSLALDQLENGGVIQSGRFKRERGMYVSRLVTVYFTGVIK